MDKKRIAAALALFLAGAAVFAGAKKENPAGVTLLRIGTEGAMPPYNFVNEKGEADGYDVALVKAIVDLLPEYRAEFVPTAWDGIFVALEGGEFDLLASYLAWRPEREEKYYLSKLPYMWYSYSVVFKKGRGDIRSLKDLEGKKIAAGVGAAYTVQLEEYIKRTGAKIEIVYTDGNVANALTELDNGRVDATISSFVTTQITADRLGYQIDSLPLTEDGWTVGSIHLLFPKTEKGRLLRDRFDGALEKLIANGKLREISRQYLFGKDYTTKEALETGA
ncbi:MAG: transporter substrate-binding domain-containing protein [Spirochaetaceae bacterium]|jgi:L-cystine transport system substrate-binding protein|nr:transporter substrate-binding domain-containing protein [Spirochaetaceae bacterium]